MDLKEIKKDNLNFCCRVRSNIIPVVPKVLVIEGVPDGRVRGYQNNNSFNVKFC